MDVKGIFHCEEAADIFIVKQFSLLMIFIRVDDNVGFVRVCTFGFTPVFIDT